MTLILVDIYSDTDLDVLRDTGGTMQRVQHICEFDVRDASIYEKEGQWMICITWTNGLSLRLNVTGHVYRFRIDRTNNELFLMHGHG